MAKSWAERQVEKGVRLELTPFYPRNCWKKYKGKVHYLNYPLTKEGYETALLEWRSIAARLDEERPHAKKYHIHRSHFLSVRTWYEVFGVPTEEKPLAKQVDEFLDWIDAELQQPNLPDTMPDRTFTSSTLRATFYDDFVDTGSGYTLFGSDNYELPPKWQERIRHMEERGKPTKRPQTIGYWLDAYLIRVDERTHHAIQIRTGSDRDFKLRNFRRWIDDTAHVSTIGHATIRDYHTHLAKTDYSKSTKDGYFKAFRMFVNWASKEPDCELSEPSNLHDREFTFREPKGTGRKREAKKQLLWTPGDFAVVLNEVPLPYRCYLVLMLNCGFRNVDVSALQWSDVRLDEKRIVYQREKLNQNDTSPVVNYPLWDITVKLIRESQSQHEVHVFRTSTGGPLVVQKREDGEKIVYDNLSRYWRMNRKNYGLLGKRLDFIRKTGSTTIERLNRGLETLYLGDSLQSVARIHYNFNDGERFPELDDAIMRLGEQFGLAESSSTKPLSLPSQLIDSLASKAAAQGVTIEELLAQLT